nr:hypothetical protein [Bordetella bronchiseptica]
MQGAGGGQAVERAGHGGLVARSGGVGEADGARGRGGRIDRGVDRRIDGHLLAFQAQGDVLGGVAQPGGEEGVVGLDGVELAGHQVGAEDGVVARAGEAGVGAGVGADVHGRAGQRGRARDDDAVAGARVGVGLDPVDGVGGEREVAVDGQRADRDARGARRDARGDDGAGQQRGGAGHARALQHGAAADGQAAAQFAGAAGADGQGAGLDLGMAGEGAAVTGQPQDAGARLGEDAVARQLGVGGAMVGIRGAQRSAFDAPFLRVAQAPGQVQGAGIAFDVAARAHDIAGDGAGSRLVEDQQGGIENIAADRTGVADQGAVVHGRVGEAVGAGQHQRARAGFVQRAAGQVLRDGKGVGGVLDVEAAAVRPPGNGTGGGRERRALHAQRAAVKAQRRAAQAGVRGHGQVAAGQVPGQHRAGRAGQRQRARSGLLQRREAAEDAGRADGAHVPRGVAGAVEAQQVVRSE